MKFSIKDFLSKFDHLLKKSLMENFIFCAVLCSDGDYDDDNRRKALKFISSPDHLFSQSQTSDIPREGFEPVMQLYSSNNHYTKSSCYLVIFSVRSLILLPLQIYSLFSNILY